mgnify:CR=1 FL=1
MSEVPWLTTNSLYILELLLESYKRVFQRSFKIGNSDKAVSRALAQQVFVLDTPLIAHGNGSDPLIIYANAAVLRIWRMQWHEMVGMPSRLTAPVEEQNQRTVALKQAMQWDGIVGYQGVRIDSRGHRFSIQDARIWKLWDKDENVVGQAATFQLGG